MKIDLRITVPKPGIGPFAKGTGDYTPILLVLRMMTRIDQWHCENGRFVPLYRSGVRYETERGEIFKDTPALYDEGVGDCDDIGPARTGELRAGTGLVLRGGRYVSQRHPINARTCIVWHRMEDGGTMIHVVTLWPNGIVEDPSRILGMGDQRISPHRRPTRIAILPP